MCYHGYCGYIYLMVDKSVGSYKLIAADLASRVNLRFGSRDSLSTCCTPNNEFNYGQPHIIFYKPNIRCPAMFTMEISEKNYSICNLVLRVSINKCKKFWEEVITYSSLIRHGLHRKRRLLQFFVATGTCLANHCQATIREYTYRHTGWRAGFMKYAVEIGLGATMYIPSFVKTGPGIHRHTDIQTVTWYHKPTFIFFKVKKVGWK
jgi:hypothetical protein